jgi:hypothetical protein
LNSSAVNKYTLTVLRLIYEHIYLGAYLPARLHEDYVSPAG